MAQKKRDFILQEGKKIEMRNAFIAALETMAETVSTQKWDGKVVNKRFIDKMQAAFKEKGTKVNIYFDKDYKGERKNRLKLYFTDREILENNSSLDHYACEEYLYFAKGEDYIDPVSFRFNEANFLAMAAKKADALKEANKDGQQCIDGVDEAIRKYKEMAAYIKDAMESIPSPLKKYIDLSCPIYE